MNFNANYFELFALPQSFTLDLPTLEQRYLELQNKIHPDRYVNAGEQERRLSLQWATRVNEAYQILKKPLSRAQYLLGLHGYDVNKPGSALSEEFLSNQIVWRERISDALFAADVDQLEAFHDEITHHINAQYVELASLLDDSASYESALECVRQLMFLEKLRRDANEAIATLEK